MPDRPLPPCPHNDTKVVDSRRSLGGVRIRRRRCLICWETYRTREVSDYEAERLWREYLYAYNRGEV